MQLHHIPLDHLKVSPLNMRHSRKKPDVSDILPSIRQRGIIQPLLVKPNGAPDHYEIYAGRRRFFAMKAIAKEAGSNPVLPCLVLDRNEDVDAIEASIIENAARVAPDEMEQYEAFKKLADKGRSVAEIAETFGVTELTVKRRLALANLLPAIRKLYATKEIDSRTVTALTLATEAQQQEWLTLFQSEDDHAPRGQSLKAWLCGGEHITVDKAIFDIEDYSGVVLADLFGEHGVFADADLFWSHQNAAIASLRDAYAGKGWSDCEVLDRGSYFARWDHVKATKKEGGKVFIEVRDTGEVTVHEGYITEAEHRRREKLAAGKDGKAEPATKPELTNPAQNYIELHRHASVRAALLSAPAVALRLTVAHMIGGSALWQTRPDPQTTRKEETAESVARSETQATFDTEKSYILKLLGLPEHGHSVTRSFHYGAGKAALIHMTQTAAFELAEHGINVNGIAPGVVDTEMWVKVDKQFGKDSGKKPGEVKAEIDKLVPYGRFGVVEDMTGAAVFLASDDSEYIIAQTLNVDGGRVPG